MLPSVVRPIFALLLAALLAALQFGALGAQEPTPSPTPSTVVRLTPAQQTVDAGADASVDIMIDNVVDADGLASYEFTLAFDPRVLAFESYTNGAFLGSTGRTVQCLAPLFDIDGDGEDDPGFVRVGCVTFALAPPGPTGSGTLGTFAFTTLCGDSSDLTFDLVGLSTPGSLDIPSRSENGSVDVAGTPCPSGTQGDADCGGGVDPVDAAFVLQFTAALIPGVPCPDLADVNLDELINALDATLILQFVAGLISNLPP